MKKMFIRLVLTVACMGLGVAYADNHEMSKTQKDECLLMSQQCKTSALTIQEKIQKLQDEISKGKRVYTKEEIKRLNDKLKDAEQTLDMLTTGP